MARRVVTERDRQRAKKNLSWGIAIGCAVISLGMFLVVIVSYFRLVAKPPPPPEAAYSPPVQSPGSPHAPSVEQQVRDIGRASRSGRPEPVALHVTPDQLRADVAPVLQKKGVEDLQFYFGYGTIAGQGKANVHGRPVHATVRLRPRIANGQLRFDVEDARIGMFPMPSGLRRQLQTEIDKAVAENPPEEGPVWWESVDVTPQGMTLRGQTIPATR